MRIGLLGFTFQNENKGCEALTYAVISILEELYPNDLEIVDFTYNDENLEFIKESFKKIKFYKNVIKLKDIKFNTIKELKKCDSILDITFGDNFSDIYLPYFVKRTTRMKIISEIVNKNLIIMPQTIGPFKDEKILKMALKAIKNSKRVYTRDILSKDFVLKYLPKKDVFVTTDLALALPYEKEIMDQNKKKIGINVSGLLWNGGFIENNQFGLKVDYRNYICSLIEKIHDMNEYEIHLIPHVIDNFNMAKDGDLKICKELSEKYPYTKLAPEFNTPIEAKNYISAMNIFIGARMHATIAAFSAYVPTIPFAYSRKFEGLYKNIDYKYFIDGREETTDSAIKKTFDYIEKSDILYEDLKKSMIVVNDYLNEFKKDLKINIDKQEK